LAPERQRVESLIECAADGSTEGSKQIVTNSRLRFGSIPQQCQRLTRGEEDRVLIEVARVHRERADLRKHDLFENLHFPAGKEGRVRPVNDTERSTASSYRVA
jgi:hypothetical protein